MEINCLWVCVITDEMGNESIGGYHDPVNNQWRPIIAADERHLESLKPYIHHLSVVSKNKVKIIKFSNKEEINGIN